jgi:hypothetical protein
VAEDGRDPAGTPRARRLELAGRAAKWIAAVLVVSLLLPAATKQWSDNQQQRQLKSQVSTRLAGAVANATSDGGFLLSNQTQQGQKPKTLYAAYQETLSTWKSEWGAIAAQLRGYFATTPDPKDDLQKDHLLAAMYHYGKLVELYITFCYFQHDLGDRRTFYGYGNHNDGFVDSLRRMREHTGETPTAVPVPEEVLTSLHTDPGDRRLPVHIFQDAAQNKWAQNIVTESDSIIRMINDRQARGFQVGVRAFLRQIFYPFG